MKYPLCPKAVTAKQVWCCGRKWASSLGPTHKQMSNCAKINMVAWHRAISWPNVTSGVTHMTQVTSLISVPWLQLSGDTFCLSNSPTSKCSSQTPEATIERWGQRTRHDPGTTQLISLRATSVMFTAGIWLAKLPAHPAEHKHSSNVGSLPALWPESSQYLQPRSPAPSHTGTEMRGERTLWVQMLDRSQGHSTLKGSSDQEQAECASASGTLWRNPKFVFGWLGVELCFFPWSMFQASGPWESQVPVAGHWREAGSYQTFSTIAMVPEHTIP